MTTKKIVPATKTPPGVFLFLIFATGTIGLILCSFLGVWGFIPLCLIFAFSTSLYTENGIPTFHGLIMQNGDKMRIIFPGIFNLKYPWEKAQRTPDGKKKYRDLTAEIGEVTSETYATQDGIMDVKYTWSIRPSLIGKNPEEDFLIYCYYTDKDNDYLKTAGRALFSQLLSDYFSRRNCKDLLNKEFIQNQVFGSEDFSSVFPIPAKMTSFMKKHGAICHVTVEDSDLDPKIQDYRNLVAEAKSVDDAINALMKGGMNRVNAEKFIKLMKAPEGYKETDFNLNVDAPHLTNLQNVTLMGAVGSNKKGEQK